MSSLRHLTSTGPGTLSILDTHRETLERSYRKADLKSLPAAGCRLPVRSWFGCLGLRQETGSVRADAQQTGQLRRGCYLRPELSAGPLRLVQLCLELPQQLSLDRNLLLQGGVLRLHLSQSFLRVGRLHLNRLSHILEIRNRRPDQISYIVQMFLK